jgi:hypothetical protein
MSSAIPVRRLRETESVMAFHHPKPSYAFHVLLAPKRAVASFLDLEPDSAFLIELTVVVQSHRQRQRIYPLATPAKSAKTDCQPASAGFVSIRPTIYRRAVGRKMKLSGG